MRWMTFAVSGLLLKLHEAFEELVDVLQNMIMSWRH